MLAFYLSMLETQEDKDKFEYYYKTYRKSMYKVAFGILHNKYDTEDAVHEAFLCIANNLDKISTLSVPKLKSYFVIIIRNASLDIYRRNMKMSEKSSDIDDNDIPIDVDFFEKIDYNRIIDMIAQLPEINRDAMSLFYVQHLSVKEIAAMFNTSKSVIYKRLDKGKKLLKELLEKGESYV